MCSILGSSNLYHLFNIEVGTHFVFDLKDVEEKESKKEETKLGEEDVDEKMLDHFYRAKRAGLNLSQDRLLSVILKCLHHPEVPTPPPDHGIALS